MVTIEELMIIASKSKASDVHITVGIPPKMRVNGELINMNFPTLMPEDTKNIIGPILDLRHKEILDENGEVDFSFSIQNIGRCRVNVFKQRGSMAAALRLVGTSIPKPEELTIPESVVEIYRKKRGLVLVTGPTGSGKSTTLASLIDVINEKTSSHVITLEDPIEYLHQHKNSMVNQREIGLDTHSYSNALRVALREDPDVILVGDLRDIETVSIAITAAETGHLVLSTLHTNGAVNTIERIIDIFPPHQQQQIKVQLANVLEAVISQQLIPTADNKNRVAAFVVMHSTAVIKNLIREGKTDKIPEAIAGEKDSGMQTMDEAIFKLYLEGLINSESAINFSRDSVTMSDKVGKVC